MIRDYYTAGKLDQFSDELLRDSLSDEARASLGKIHPTFMGGEYLPNYRRQEVEIASIALASTTSDVGIRICDLFGLAIQELMRRKRG